MYRRGLLAACALVACALAAHAGGLGFRLSAVRRDSLVVLRWQTDAQPPYVVALYTPYVAAFGTGKSRYACAMRYRVVTEPYCAFRGDFRGLRGDVVAQVSTAVVTNSPHFKEMSAGEFEAYAGDLHDILDPGMVERAKARDPGDMELVGDHLWGCFSELQTPYVTVNARCRGFQLFSTNWVQTSFVEETSYYSNTVNGATSGFRSRSFTNDLESVEYDVPTNVVKVLGTAPEGWVKVFEQHIVPFGDRRRDRRGIRRTYNPDSANPLDDIVESETGARTFGPFDVSVGTGYRILYNDLDDRFTVERAYSMLPDFSGQLVLRRNVKALTAFESRKVGMDWLGQLRYVECTNAVPMRIYWEGL